MAIKYIYVNGTETNLDPSLVESDPIGYLFTWVEDICRELGYTGGYSVDDYNSSGGISDGDDGGNR